jgi:hypothetical protein
MSDKRHFVLRGGRGESFMQFEHGLRWLCYFCGIQIDDTKLYSCG